LSIGTTPYEVDPGLTRVESGGVELAVLGNVEPSPGANAVHLKALGLSEVSAQGIQIRLARDDEAVFASLEGKVSANGGADTAPDQP